MARPVDSAIVAARAPCSVKCSVVTKLTAAGLGSAHGRSQRDRTARTRELHRNVEWLPTTLSTVIVPSCASTIAFVIASPSPVPLIAWSIALRVRKKRSKRCNWSVAEIPSPVSDTSKIADPSWRAVRTATVPPFGVKLIAFETRLSISCPTRIGSASMSSLAARLSVSSISFARAFGRADSTQSAASCIELDLMHVEREHAAVRLRDEQ